MQRAAATDAIVVCAAGGLPGELHKLWRAGEPGTYHLEYGYSCMGYEIAGGLGVKLAAPEREVIVMVGDGSYLMMNSEIATSVMLGLKLTIVVLDNGGFGCIDRLQRRPAARRSTICSPTANTRLCRDRFRRPCRKPRRACREGRRHRGARGRAGPRSAAPRTSVIVIDTDPAASTAGGRAWVDVAVPEVSARTEAGRGA